MKNVLLLVHQDPGQEARFKVALDVTRTLSGRLNCLDITPFPLVFDQGMGMAPAFLIDETEQEAANKIELQRRIEAEDIRWKWDDIRDDFIPCLIEAAASADVVVLNRKLDSPSRRDMRSIVSSLLQNTSALVIAVNEDAKGLPAGRPALIAWDGSEKASHAMQLALPLLKRASRVTIFQVGDLPEDAISAQAAVSFLARYHIASEIKVIPESKQIGDKICDAVERTHSAFCVMGAFGHSRLRETLFGGVTRDMLSRATVPLVLAR